jgi:hypothetical protein
MARFVAQGTWLKGIDETLSSSNTTIQKYFDDFD